MPSGSLVRDGLRVLLQANSTDDPLASPAIDTEDDGLQPHAGAWARGWDVVMCLLPIAFLITTTLVKQVHMDTSKSLPLAAFLMWIVRLAYLKLDPLYTNAALLYGLFNALTPLSIIAGAICLFQAMEQTKCLPWMMARVRSLSSGHPVAEVFLIGWAFVYMIEGASGFGTPVALAAPMLVSLGHPPVASISCCLIMDTLATVHGAVGFPIWFGLAGLDPPLDDSDLRQTGFRAQVMLFAAAHVVPLIAASFLVRWRDLARSWLFILLAIWAAKVPAVAIAIVSTDFSTLIGGMIAVLLVGVLARFRIGLGGDPGHKFDLPPLETAGSASMLGHGGPTPAPNDSASIYGHITSPSGTADEGSAHGSAPPKHRPPPPIMLPDQDAMLAPSGVGVFGGSNASGRTLAERKTSIGPAAVSGMEGTDEDDIFATADGDAPSGALPPAAATDGEQNQPARRWKVYSPDQGRGSGRGGAVAEGFRHSAAQGCDACMRKSCVEVWPAQPGDVGTLQHAAAGRLHSGLAERRWLAGRRGGEAVAEGWRRNGSSPSPPGEGENGGSAYPKHELPQLRSLESMDSDLESGKHRPSQGGGIDDLSNIDPNWPAWATMVLRTMPLWLTVLLLLITRIEPLGVRDVIQDADPNFDIDLGLLFKFELSASLVVRISEIFGLPPGSLAWKYELLYIPFLLPFVAVSIVTVGIFRRNLPEGATVLSPFMEAARRAAGVVPALMGSLVLVALLREAAEGVEKPAYIIGFNLADFMKEGFIAIAAILGALGSFFSGSTTVSNLTFGIVHQVAARNIDVSETGLLALQSVGATAGNMICINNIIAAKAVVGGAALGVTEGAFIQRTAPALAVMITIATLVALPFLFL
eukprot:jgi/Ulvmu1/6848/UM031_0053.1